MIWRNADLIIAAAALESKRVLGADVNEAVFIAIIASIITAPAEEAGPDTL